MACMSNRFAQPRFDGLAFVPALARQSFKIIPCPRVAEPAHLALNSLSEMVDLAVRQDIPEANHPSRSNAARSASLITLSTRLLMLPCPAHALMAPPH